MPQPCDRWHRSLLDTRHGDDAAYRERMLTEVLYPVRDAVLDKGLPPGASWPWPGGLPDERAEIEGSGRGRLRRHWGAALHVARKRDA